MIPRLLFTIEMELQLSIDIFFSESIDEPLSISLWTVVSLCVSVVNAIRNWSLAVTGQTNQSFCMLRQFISCDGTLARFRMLWHAHFHQRNQAAKILITSPIANEQRKCNYRL